MDRIIEDNKVTLWMGNEAYEKIKNGAEVVIESPCKEPFALTKVEKKQLCECCNEDKYDFDKNFIQDNKNKQIIFFPTSSWEAIKKLHINYCPMCGRRLK